MTREAYKGALSQKIIESRTLSLHHKHNTLSYDHPDRRKHRNICWNSSSHWVSRDYFSEANTNVCFFAFITDNQTIFADDDDVSNITPWLQQATNYNKENQKLHLSSETHASVVFFPHQSPASTLQPNDVSGSKHFFPPDITKSLSWLCFGNSPELFQKRVRYRSASSTWNI